MMVLWYVHIKNYVNTQMMSKDQRVWKMTIENSNGISPDPEAES